MTTINNYAICKKYLNKQVQIKTVHGTYQGKIVKVDKDKVYLQSNAPRGKNRGKATISFFPIIPLVLFDLLVIILLDGRRHRHFY